MNAVSKLVNEMYQRYNMKQFPFSFINLIVDQSNVDINISKSKCQVEICYDKVLQMESEENNEN